MTLALAEGLPEAFQLQASFSPQLGSPIYGEVLNRCAEELRAGSGIIADVLDGWVGRPVPDAVALRLAGAVHRIALRGDAPELAPLYPSVGGRAEIKGVWQAFRAVVARHFDEVRAALQQQVQTNEVSRCAALAGGFFYIAERTPLPLRLLEIGSSGGLNQNWDRYRYERDGAAIFGPRDSPVRIACRWSGEPPPLPAAISVASRAGCDISPLDVGDEATSLRLQSFVWPEQVERLRLLRAAIEVARRHPPSITRSSGPPWLAEQLRAPMHGVATVVFHSIMWWYMSRDERDTVTRTIEEAGRRADHDAPLAWLQLELAGDELPRLSVRRWPGDGEAVLLGRAHPHGGEVWWEAAASARI